MISPLLAARSLTPAHTAAPDSVTVLHRPPFVSPRESHSVIIGEASSSPTIAGSNLAATFIEETFNLNVDLVSTSTAGDTVLATPLKSETWESLQPNPNYDLLKTNGRCLATKSTSSTPSTPSSRTAKRLVTSAIAFDLTAALVF
ncbi:hypothetical protein H257_14764 [Aphanomyces astaci]|uniref:Uncharacterized protein n=1 Tax=Aphanomyces astaci TaxID=112090 RepID=W4FSB9_APHAT|nr:hypothetical protein H257_14764 [Aphanomyces astaci]ETV69528.1 hypothetical protein H257_14764 [Aphanomyces astaci]|eukprot:XP_009840952.1 hypothetical protein H257_14764 [Aphanomyces astaci]